MRSINKKWIVITGLIVIPLILTNLTKFRQVYYQKAQSSSSLIIFNTAPGGLLKRTWPYLSQGGEGTDPMIWPAFSLIKQLGPKMIRLDHFFDFPNREMRLIEVKQIGAIPFISLSYFPPEISPDPTTMPESLDRWENLVTETVKYTNRTFTNDTVYYEVWNEPDLFGKMSPETYFTLYQSTTRAIEKCPECKNIRIGGPAITSLRSDWLNRFLYLVAINQTRLDFISWHSYQRDPTETLNELRKLKLIPPVLQFSPPPELIISEWGITPEISPLNDSYEAAVHTVGTIVSLGDLIDKMFTFEIKDGPSPEGKQFWGRWGLLTNENYGLSTKPRYYAMVYLNKLLQFRLPVVGANQNIYSLGSTDGKGNYTLIFSTTNNYHNPTLNVRLEQLALGNYTKKLYFLDSLHNPTVPTIDTIVVPVSGNIISIPTIPLGTYALELTKN